jgi:hypothetical protein
MEEGVTVRTLPAEGNEQVAGPGLAGIDGYASDLE